MTGVSLIAPMSNMDPTPMTARLPSPSDDHLNFVLELIGTGILLIVLVLLLAPRAMAWVDWQPVAARCSAAPAVLKQH